MDDEDVDGWTRTRFWVEATIVGGELEGEEALVAVKWEGGPPKESEVVKEELGFEFDLELEFWDDADGFES